MTTQDMIQHSGFDFFRLRRIGVSVILFVLFAIIPAKAQLAFSDSISISLLTIDPGPNAYECFGHTALRINDLKGGSDITFHYGVYNYNEPNFIWHFIEGKCNYMIGACYTEDFLHEYVRRKLNVTEQVLNLDSAQNAHLADALITNYLPKNRNYRYNFFFDNCATRPFDMINKFAPVRYDTTWTQPVTLRDMLHEKTGMGHWLDFGIALAVAGRADKQASFREQMFLPSYLCEALKHAQIHGEPLVSKTAIYHNATESQEDKDAIEIFSPMNIGVILLLVAAILSILDIRREKTSKIWHSLSKSFDFIWLLATGITGCIIWYLNFFSEHPAVDNNINCWWLLPTNLLFIAIIWLKSAEKVRRIYFFIIFAAEIVYIISVCVSAQYFHLAFLPWLMTISLRCLINICKK